MLSNRVVCRMMGLTGGRAIPYTNAGAGKIWLDDVQCTGSEERLTDCYHGDWGVHDCNHMEDVAVECGERDPGRANTIVLILYTQKVFVVVTYNTTAINVLYGRYLL